MFPSMSPPVWIAELLSARFTHLRYDSGVQTFLRTPNTYGWDVKRKLVWLGQHSYLFRLHCEQYIRDHSRADFTHGLCPECYQLYSEQFPAGRKNQ